MRWIKYEGYDETHQYVDEKGRILGVVHGSRFQEERGWYGSDETTVPATHLGRYVSVDEAKAAIEARHFNNDPKWLEERAKAEDGCMVSVGGLVVTMETIERARTEAIAFIRRLATSEENGAIVSSGACSVMEITFARSEGRFWVDPETSCGYVLRMKRWRELAESAIHQSTPQSEGSTTSTPHQNPKLDNLVECPTD
jgi:hypothetical protein